MKSEGIQGVELGIAMPVFNEERWLDTVFKQVLLRPEVVQLVAVDDGSTDHSWNKLQFWSQADLRVQVVRHSRNQGKGAAIHTALKQITTPLVLIQDADLEYRPEDYPKLLEPVLRGEADVVYGSRFLDGTNGNPKWHTAGNRLLTRAARWITRLPLTDEATCYKLFQRELLIGMDLRETGFGFCPEVTAKAARRVRAGEIRLLEVPVRYHGRTVAEGKKIRLKDGLDALICLWKYRNG